MTIEWKGRQLVKAINKTTNEVIEYRYNDSGYRTYKKVTTDSNHYDEYFYMRNLQQDVIALLDNSGNIIVEYQYDVWGNIIHQTNNTLAKINPYRYRGYQYDEETKWYYLNSRYYNLEIGRFINADGLIGSTGDLLGHNLFAYCQNNPVTRVDFSGNAWNVIYGLFWFGEIHDAVQDEFLKKVFTKHLGKIDLAKKRGGKQYGWEVKSATTSLSNSKYISALNQLRGYINKASEPMEKGYFLGSGTFVYTSKRTGNIFQVTWFMQGNDGIIYYFYNKIGKVTQPQPQTQRSGKVQNTTWGYALSGGIVTGLLLHGCNRLIHQIKGEHSSMLIPAY